MGQIAVKQKLRVHCFLCSWRAFSFLSNSYNAQCTLKGKLWRGFVQTSNVTWNWKCRCWIPFFFISFVHCWVFIVGNSFFSFGISIPFKEQFNKRILRTVEFFHLENFLKTKRKSFDWNVVIVRCAWDHKSSVLKHPVQQVMSHSVWQSITTV